MSLVAKKFVLRVTSAWTENGAVSATDERDRESCHDVIVSSLQIILIDSGSKL